MGKGKNKGSGGERDMARRFSLWWTNNERDDVFWRTPGSGSRATVRTKLDKATSSSYGDLTSLDPVGDPLIQCCTFEIKTGYNNTQILICIDGKGKKYELIQFLDQVKKDARDAGNSPVLIINRDYMRPTIFMPRDLFNDLSLYCGDFTGNIAGLRLDINETWAIMALDDFFDWVNPQYFIDKMKIKNNA